MISVEDLYSVYRECRYTVSTDSRSIAGGELFFALRGENFDGNVYAASALEKGASWAVVSQDCKDENDRFIRVDDPFRMLQALATFHRTTLGLPVIGLTGTNGKTTTKELVAAVLKARFEVCATEGNLNNDIGVPLSLLKIRPGTEIAVIEMGASHPDDIEKLVKVCRPDYGLITNVGKAHLQGFGSFEGVKAAKGALYRWLGSHEGGVIFLNEDDAVLKEMARKEACHVFGYGLDYQGAKVLTATPSEPYVRIRLSDGAVVSTRLVGSYNATNVMAALAIGEYMGVSRAGAIAAIEAYEPSNKRSQLEIAGDNTLIIDAYNANPSSMGVALDNLEAMDGESKLALLGDMRELGDDSLAEHIAVVERLLPSGINFFLVGEEFRKALIACDIPGMQFTTVQAPPKNTRGTSAEPGSIVPVNAALPEDCGFRGWFASSSELAMELGREPVRNSIVLIKGSRGTRMENVLGTLQAVHK